ncbi:hypothetical protein N7488_000577 [Penicillium malachiteum]|nr:hypothetical protein N7488_000577 [Penicillium malachiteum]
MRRCLCPSGLLRTGRGSSTSLLSPPLPSYPALSRLHAQSITTKSSRLPEKQLNKLRHKELKLILSYNELPPPPASVNLKGQIKQWIPSLSRALRASREAFADKPQTATSLLDHAKALEGGYNLRAVLYHARTLRSLDLLSYWGFHNGRWPLAYAALGSLVDTYELLMPHMTPRQLLSESAWQNPGMTLDELTGQGHDDLIIKRQLIPICPPTHETSLQQITSFRPAVRKLANTFLEETFVNLGLLILTAADQSAEKADIAMSYIYRLLARLHHLDLISDRVYQSPNSHCNEYSVRPPGLHLLSGHIMSVLSDAAWVEHEAALADAAAEAGEDPPFVPFKVGVRELGPEIWFEFILWCCVEHGFNKQGAWLVEQMSKRQGNLSWKVESWAPLMQALDVVQQTNISLEKSWRRPDHITSIETRKSERKPAFNGLGPRTISSEVVLALRVGLANNAHNAIGFHGLSPSKLLKHSAPLNALLDPPGPKDELRPTKKVATENIIRILESGCLVPMEDPNTFDKVLRSTQSLVPSWESKTIPSTEELDQMTRAQLYNQTAALAGLVEYNVQSYSYKGQASTAFIQYSLLQNITDASKAQHIQAFFERLSQSPSTDVEFFDSQLFDSLQVQQSSLSQVSITTLAHLLDLAASTRADTFGNWLLFNDELDGPAIPPTLYGSPALAPSILRFAAATQNKELSKSVIKSLEMPLSVNTLKAMANLHITFGDWDRAILAFEYMRDHRPKSWGFGNIMMLAAKIVRLEGALARSRSNGADPEVQAKLTHSLSRATAFLRRFFDGEFNTPRGKNRRTSDFQWRVLERTRGMFSTVPGALAREAKVELKHKFRSRDKIGYVSSVSFHILLSAITEVRGAQAGRDLLFKWCQNLPNPALWRKKEGGVTRLALRAERDFAESDPTYYTEWHRHVAQKAVIPNLNTIRIIARVASLEFSKELMNNFDPSSPEKDHPARSLLSESTSTPSPASSSQTRTPKVGDTFKQDARYRIGVSKKIFQHQSANGGLPPSSPAEEILDECVNLFLHAGMPEEQIDFEIPGHLSRLQARQVLTGRRAKRVRDRFKEIQNGPWMNNVLKERYTFLKPRSSRKPTPDEIAVRDSPQRSLLSSGHTSASADR